ncbi:MAG TPA: DPP IV N-terminal domain-containing protein [Cyclobacteriaceae bacterium]|nr:DPP IV N-terminal domain-containing protein [Cyclobacteriaceae bacterium]
MRRLLLLLIILSPVVGLSQDFRWTGDNKYVTVESGELVQYVLPAANRTVVASANDLTPSGQRPLTIKHWLISPDQSRILIFTNTKKVWRLETRGDYWVLDVATKQLKKLGNGLPASSLMFARFSPDNSKVAYVSEYNVFTEDISTGEITKHTTDGNRKHINGTFDWAYEEEFSCREGFVWGPDSKQLAFWQVDATKIRDFYMINNTDSVYSRIVPVEYPTAGQTPSPVRIGVIDVATSNIKWAPVPGEPSQHYIPRIEWNSASELFIQQMNRKQNESKLFSYNTTDNSIKVITTDNDEAWIDIFTPWENVYALDFRHKINWINGGKEFIWFSEKDGWRHVYRVGKDGKTTLITKGDFDVLDIKLIDEKGKLLYYLASPTNATQKYLYRSKLDGTGKPERVTPADQPGSHTYNLSPGGKFAYHTFSNSYTKPRNEWVSLPDHKLITGGNAAAPEARKVQFFKLKTQAGVEMDAWMVKPTRFDSTKRYPVLFYVYTEPWGANVIDQYGVADNFLFDGDLADEGYIYISVDNRGTPAPKGRAWRKSIYRKIGRLNIQDQADAAKEILKWKFVDPERVAVWGWSGGGAATLNLMFQYPEIYKTGIAVAAVTNQLTYDNIYQERFMGLPQENLEDFVSGSPLTYAKNLKGNLLYIHGTGDDNVHYANGEMLINELVKQGKQFQLMVYPNRTHSISEGEGTTEHLQKLYSDYLRKYCPPGAR